MTEYQKELLEKAAALSDAYNRMQQVFARNDMPQLAQAVADFMHASDTRHNTGPLAVEWDAVWNFIEPKKERKAVCSTVGAYFTAHRAFHTYVSQCEGNFGSLPEHKHSWVRGLLPIMHFCDSGHMRIDHDGEILPDNGEALFHCEECDTHRCEDCFTEEYPNYRVAPKNQAVSRSAVEGEEPMWKNEIPWNGGGN